MIETVREYLWNMILGGVITAIVGHLAGKGIAGSAVRFVCGLLMLLLVAAPASKLSFSPLTDIVEEYQNDAQSAAEFGQQQASDALREGISDRVQTYILEKARSLDAEVSVSVTLSDTQLPVPCGVIITGSVAPYAKSVLAEYMGTSLGIPKEAQIWRS